MPLSEDEKARIDVNYFEASKGLTRRRPPAPMHQSTNAMVPLVVSSSVSDQSPSSSSSTLERRHVISMSSSPKVEMNGFAQFSNINATLDNANNNRVEQNGYANSVFFTNEDLLDNCFSNEQTVDTEIRNAAMNDDSNSVGSTGNDRAPLLPDGDHYELTNLSTSPVLDKNISVAHAKSLPHTEGACTIGVQVFIPFLIAGFGTVGAGLVLDLVQHWRVFTEVTQIFILVPALLGLKGNLEMTLASRMSTLAHLGLMDTKSERMKQIISNLALIQVQAAMVAFLAAVFAVILGWVPKGVFSWDNTFLLCASSLATASMASFILGMIMVLVVILSRHFHINPDNVATPIAASLGDLTTLSLLATVGTLLNRCKDSEFWVSPMVICFFIMLCPLWIWMSLRNPVTREVLISGWSPVIFSMLISSFGGFILEYTVARFRGIAVFQPVINGIGGNLVAVQASRLSTSLHKSSRLGVLPAESPKTCVNPCETFCGKQVSSVAARVLLALVVPGHLIFMYTINFLRAGHTTISLVFAIVYLTAAVIQVALLLYICHWMVHSMWKRKVDPDNSAIPYLTALGDLLGTALLAIAFQILYRIGDHDADLGE